MLLAALVLSSFSALAEPCKGFTDSMAQLEMAVLKSDPNSHQTSQPFRTQFLTRIELEEWAQGSTFGGGTITEINFQGETLLMVSRSYTSGIKSADLAVYQFNQGEWDLIKTYPQITGSWIDADAYADKIVFRRDDGKNALVVLTPQDLKYEY